MSYNPDVIDPAEQISRFACESSYYRKDGTARPKAFQADSDNEVSVFRIDYLGEVEVWTLGDVSCAARDKPAKASIEFAAIAVEESGLQLAISEPPERHAAIRGWSDDQNRLRNQQQLAAASTVKVRAAI